MTTQTEWQPIETAPRDGTRVLVRHEIGDYGRRFAKPTGVFIDGKWVCSEMFIDPTTMRIYHDPTHWMPLNNGETVSSKEG